MYNIFDLEMKCIVSQENTTYIYHTKKQQDTVNIGEQGQRISISLRIHKYWGKSLHSGATISYNERRILVFTSHHCHHYSPSSPDSPESLQTFSEAAAAHLQWKLQFSAQRQIDYLRLMHQMDSIFRTQFGAIADVS